MPQSSRTNARKIRASFRFICSLNFICYLLLLLLLLLLCECMIAWYGSTPAMVCMLRSEDNFMESILFFHLSTRSGDWTQVARGKAKTFIQQIISLALCLKSLSSVQIKYFFGIFIPGGSIFGSFDVNGTILFLQSLLTKMLLVFLGSISKFLFSSQRTQHLSLCGLQVVGETEGEWWAHRSQGKSPWIMSGA